MATMGAGKPTATVWDESLLANPHAAVDKRTRVQRMFAAIASSYDLNNRLHSLWMDQRWRRIAVDLAGVRPTDVVVDVACGTGDLAIAFARANPRCVIGIDFTYEMLPIARAKINNQKPNLKNPHLVNGDALSLPLADGSADVVGIAFGIRNMTEPAAALREARRILRPGGRLVILEFSLPSNRLMRRLYNIYFRHILPRTATWISGDRSGAYRYLPQSVSTFSDRQQILRMMRDAGFEAVEPFPLSFGVCVCYRGWVRP